MFKYTRTHQGKNKEDNYNKSLIYIDYCFNTNNQRFPYKRIKLNQGGITKKTKVTFTRDCIYLQSEPSYKKYPSVQFTKTRRLHSQGLIHLSTG
jgi:hypothetical protein